MDAYQSDIDTTTTAGRIKEETQIGVQGKVQDSADKAKVLLGLLEATVGQTNVPFQFHSDKDGTDDDYDDDDEVDYMEDDGTFAVTEADQGLAELDSIGPVTDGIADDDSIIYMRFHGITESTPCSPEDAPSPSASSSTPIPGRLGNDIDFTAHVAAGLQRSGLDPNIVIKDPTFRRQDSPPTGYQLPSVVTTESDLADKDIDARRWRGPLKVGGSGDPPPDSPPDSQVPGHPGEHHHNTETVFAYPPKDTRDRLQQVYPVPSSDPSRFDSRRDEGPHKTPDPGRGIAAAVVGAAVGVHLPVDVKGKNGKKERRRRGGMGIVWQSGSTSSNDNILRTSPTARDNRPVGAAGPHTETSKPLRKPGFLGRVRAGALDIARRAVQYLETEDSYVEDELADDLAYGENMKSERAPVARSRDLPAQPSPAHAGPQFPSFIVLPPGNLPPPQAKPARAIRPSQPRLPGEFETLLRTKIFKPTVQLTTAFPEPPWGTRLDPSLMSLFPKPPGATLVSRTLTPLGQFVADRDRTVRETLKDVELGLGASYGGFGVDFSTKGVLGLLKPVQWINTWRSLPREVHVNSHLLESRRGRPNTTATPHTSSEKPDELERQSPSFSESAGPDSLHTDARTNIVSAEDVQHRLLHQIDHELMSSLKYQFGESQYITVITFSEASRGDRVDSGAIALFRASSFVPGRNGVQATKLDLEARFHDVPGAICRMLATEGDPNRFELRRNGKKLSVKARGTVAPLRPGVVSVVGGEGAKKRGGQESRLEGSEWAGIGSGWRKALHILLDHPDNQDRGGENNAAEEEDCPREGLVATIPQMLALLHFRYRTVDCVPSSQVFAFSSPLECNKLGESGPTGGSGGTWYVRRGLKLFGPPIGATHVGSTGTVAVLFSRESRWVREQLFWA
ncbi:hypothetical protein QBC37DRAFT_424576 [Rhypophila decipiens]|uniref:Uncharacterized protein n=1 Tax=Rhypophila decipiens TaxID=261697 RepID=A0AAN7B959_9PEZI|nr:hypothetical protein QBC37DRAFT_424576 [Rhypophila decipiens]